MPNDYFQFKEFVIYQDKCAFKVGTDGVMLGAYAKVKENDKVLDIGTGTGLIALMIAQKGGTNITAIEPDISSYEQALMNVNKSKWDNSITVLNEDLQSFMSTDQRFDLILTNPPYFVNSLKNPDPRKSATRHTDTLSTDDILAGVARLLTDNGRFQIILPFVEGNIFIAESAGYGLFCNQILKIKPLPTSEIRRMILTFSRKRIQVSEKFLIIEKGQRHQFTEDYINITRNFYLNF